MATPRIRRSGAAGVVAAALLAGGPADVPSAAAGSGAQSCRGPGAAWRVDYEVTDSGEGPRAQATGLRRRALPDGAWTDASARTWQLRWDNPPSAWADPLAGPFRERQGDLAAVGAPVATRLSPRFVSPDGECTVYLAPFGNGNPGDPKIAVLGDSLTQSLNDPAYNERHTQGYVQGALNAAGLRAEVEGQGNRRWTAVPGTTGLGRADTYLLDEYRGLLRHGPQGYVIELGPNDAGWVADPGTAAERRARLGTTITALRRILDEMRADGRCVVLVTGPDDPARYQGADPRHYAWAARAINRELRAQASAGGGLQLRDFARRARGHHTYSPGRDVWFLGDDLHLNETGRRALTQDIAHAARQCA